MNTFRLGWGAFLELIRIPWRGAEIWDAIVKIGVGSLPIIVLSTSFAGLVVTNEIAWHMKQALFTISMTPGFTGQFILRELGIAIPALLVVSKVGASIAAEIATMKVTEQIDALQVMRIRTVSYLVFPRWVGCIIALPCLTLISIAVTLGCALLVATTKHHFETLEYIAILQKFVGPMDLVVALVKSTIFGAVIPIVACSYGLDSKFGAQGVGNATTESVVTLTLTIITLDFALTYLFSLIL